MTLCCRGFHPMNLPFIVLFSIKMMLFSETAGLCQKNLEANSSYSVVFIFRNEEQESVY